MSQLAQQAIADTTYYDSTGSSTHYYSIKFWDGTYESEFSRVIKTIDQAPHYTNVQNVRRQMNVTSTSVLADEAIEKWILFAEREIEEYTGRTWRFPTAYTEYFSITATRNTANAPIYQTADTLEYEPDAINLRYYPVTDIMGAWNVTKMQTADLVYSDDGGVFTDNTTEAGTQTGTPFNAFAATAVANDALYIGNAKRFLGLNIRLSTTSSAGIYAFEYYNGSAWTAFSNVDDKTENLDASGRITWELPLDWTANSVNSSDDSYWMRIRVTTAPSTSPKVQYVYVEDEIDVEYTLNTLEWDDTGQLTFINDILKSGSRNLRVDYKAGAVVPPVLVTDLATVLTCIRSFIAISGGSYDDMSAYQLGELNVSLGEPYVNIREAIAQLEKRRDELLGRIGKRLTLGSSGGV